MCVGAAAGRARAALRRRQERKFSAMQEWKRQLLSDYLSSDIKKPKLAHITKNDGFLLVDHDNDYHLAILFICAFVRDIGGFTIIRTCIRRPGGTMQGSLCLPGKLNFI